MEDDFNNIEFEPVPEEKPNIGYYLFTAILGGGIIFLIIWAFYQLFSIFE